MPLIQTLHIIYCTGAKKAILWFNCKTFVNVFIALPLFIQISISNNVKKACVCGPCVHVYDNQSALLITSQDIKSRTLVAHEMLLIVCFVSSECNLALCLLVLVVLRRTNDVECWYNWSRVIITNYINMSS